MANPQDVQFVVARYGENLAWLLRPEILPYAANAIVYNKGADDIGEDVRAAVKNVVQLPNVGRAEHSYMYHIVNAVKNNTLHKYTVFVPGSVYTSGEHKVNQFNTILNFLRTGALIPTWMDNIYAMFNNFTLDTWCASCPENSSLNAENALHPARVRPMGNWVQTTFGSAAPAFYEKYPITMYAVACGYRDSIMRMPITVFESIMNQLAEHSNPEVGHYVERIFGYMICNRAPYVHIPAPPAPVVQTVFAERKSLISARSAKVKSPQTRNAVIRVVGIRKRSVISKFTPTRKPTTLRLTTLRRQRIKPIR